jgi:hypothetical protein
MITRDVPPEGLVRLQWLAIPRVNISHLPFADNDERSLVHLVLPWIEAEVQPAAQQPRLKAGFALSRDNSSFAQGTVSGPYLFNHTDHGVRDVNNAEQSGQEVDYDKSCDDCGNRERGRGAKLDFAYGNCVHIG